jgi:Predicted membrane protein (DUF2254)
MLDSLSVTARDSLQNPLQREASINHYSAFSATAKILQILHKSISPPAINDPTTAVQALDEIEDLLIRWGQRQLNIGKYRDDQGALHLVVPFPTWEDFLRLALDEVRYCGASSVQGDAAHECSDQQPPGSSTRRLHPGRARLTNSRSVCSEFG